MIDLRPAPYLLGGALLVCAISALFVWGATQSVKAGSARAEQAQERAVRAQEDAEKNLASLNVLRSTLANERAEHSKLLTLQAQLRQTLAKRQHLIVSLTNENEELRQWVIQPLPDTARRLRERPALTGADAYREWLSSGRAVHAPGDEPE